MLFDAGGVRCDTHSHRLGIGIGRSRDGVNFYCQNYRNHFRVCHLRMDLDFVRLITEAQGEKPSDRNAKSGRRKCPLRDPLPDHDAAR